MNLLCPNCQKTLTVPDNAAGQTMLCPLCSGRFNVPTLANAPVVVGPPAGSPPPPQDIFRISPAPEPIILPAREEAPPLLPNAAPSGEAQQSGPTPPRPPSGPSKFSLTLQPHVVPWIAPAALAAVFVLLFFPWSSTLVYGEKPEWYSITGWGNAFGSGLGILYILLFFLALPLSVAMVALPILEIKPPVQLDALWPWRTVIASTLVGVATVILLFQLVAGGSLVSELEALAKNPEQLKDQPLAKKLKSVQEREVAREVAGPTSWYRLAVFGHFVALAGFGLQYWFQQRGTRPSPRVDVVW